MQHRLLFSEQKVRAAISRVAKQISRDFAGREIVLVGILKGAAFFLVHLAELIERAGKVKACRWDFLRVSSYRDGQTPGEIKIELDLSRSPKGQNIIVVEDVADTLHTLYHVIRHIRAQQPANLRVAVLLDKPDGHQRTDISLKYVGLSRQYAGFVYGCGMDLEGAIRGLPFITTIAGH